MTTEPIAFAGDLARYQAGDADELLDHATAAVRDYCGWHVTPSITETVTVNAVGQTLFLPSLNVTAVTAVVVNGVTVDATSYEWAAAGMVWSPTWWGFRSPQRFRNATVTFTHGFASAPAVASVVLARASRFQNNDRNATRLQAGPFGESYESGGGFTADERAILDRFRLPVLA